MTWTIYAVTVADSIHYIGHAKNLRQREHGHRADRFYGINFRMVPLATADSKSVARRIEARLIAKHRPPRNIQFCGPRSYKSVDTQRWTGSRWVPCRFRVYDGMLDPNEAREIWHRSRCKDAGAVLQRMPGWTLSRASWMFGPRQKVGKSGVIV